MKNGRRRVLCCVLVLSLTDCGGSTPKPASAKVAAPPPATDTQADEMLARRALVIQTLWTSPIGRMYHSYLFDPLTASQLRELANQILKRIFSSGGKSITYFSALHMLAEDLFERDELTTPRKLRMDILSNNIWQAQADHQSTPGADLAYYSAIAFLLTVPLGSPQVRNALKKAIQFVAPNLVSDTADVRLSQFFSKSMITDYELKKTVTKFFSYFGAASTVYFFWFVWKESARGHSIGDHLPKLNGQEEFKAYLADLARL